MCLNRLQDPALKLFALLLTTILFGAGDSRYAKTQLKSSALILSRPLRLRWQYSTTRTLNITPKATSTNVFIPLLGGTLIALRVADGQLMWQTDLSGEISSAPAVDATTIYAATVFSPALGGNQTDNWNNLQAN